MYSNEHLDYFNAQSLAYRITSQYSGSTRKTKFAMRTTDVARSGSGSFIYDVYVPDMTSHRLPVQMDQLDNMTLVTVTKDNTDDRGKTVTYSVKGRNGVVRFSVMKILPIDDDVANTTHANDIIKLHNQIVVQMYEQFIHRAEVKDSRHQRKLGRLRCKSDGEIQVFLNSGLKQIERVLLIGVTVVLEDS